MLLLLLQRLRPKQGRGTTGLPRLGGVVLRKWVDAGLLQRHCSSTTRRRGDEFAYLEIISVGTTHNPNQCLDLLKLIAACLPQTEASAIMSAIPSASVENHTKLEGKRDSLQGILRLGWAGETLTSYRFHRRHGWCPECQRQGRHVQSPCGESWGWHWA